MARTRAPRTPKAPGRLAQMWQVFQMTRRHDPTVIWMMIAVFVGPIALSVIAGVLLAGGNGFVIALYVILGVMTGVLLGLIVLGRRAEKAAYEQIEGQPGAVGAVLRSGIRGSWVSQEMPIAVTKQQDAIYRVVGRGGVVLVAEGSLSRLNKLVSDESKKISRLVPNVTITVISVGDAEDPVPLAALSRRIRRTPKVLTKAEVRAVNNRLTSMQGTIPIPKGIDPTKVRAARGRPR